MPPLAISLKISLLQNFKFSEERILGLFEEKLQEMAFMRQIGRGKSQIN